MSISFGKRNYKETNLLELIPERLFGHETDAEGIITIIIPKFKNKFLVKYLAPKFKSQNFKVSLDKFGSGTWELIDGNLEVHSIADELIKKYGADIEPVYDRLPKFLTMLYKNKLISFKGLERKGK